MVTLYDTTLRDGTQREGMSLSVEDKLRIAAKLDLLGVTRVRLMTNNPAKIEALRAAGLCATAVRADANNGRCVSRKHLRNHHQLPHRSLSGVVCRPHGWPEIENWA